MVFWVKFDTVRVNVPAPVAGVTPTVRQGEKFHLAAYITTAMLSESFFILFLFSPWEALILVNSNEFLWLVHLFGYSTKTKIVREAVE